MDDARSGHRLEHLSQEVGLGPKARRWIVDLAWIALGIGDEFRHRLHWQLRVDHQHDGTAGDHRHRGKALDRVVVEIFVDRGPDGERPWCGEEQRVAVGLRACGRLGADRSASPARPILDHDRLPERRSNAVRDQPGRDIDPARRERHDDLDRPVRIGLGGRRTGGKRAKARCGQRG